jgi:predicted amidohydrolase
MQDLTITLVQAELAWEDAAANLFHFDRIFEKFYEPTDLIILPEMFNTGFTMNTSGNAEDMNGLSMTWMAETAMKLACTLCGSLIIRENGNFYNRLIWMQPDGKYSYYDKRHLFRMGEEHHYYTAGNKKMITELKGWKLMPLICYDLRFPVWSKNDYKEEAYAYDLLIYIANWPESRREVWKSLLVARALENQCYVIGLNRIGTDGKGISYSGDSMLIDPRGIIISKTKAYTESVETVKISLKNLQDFRKKFPAYLDADDFSIHY